MRVLVTGGLGFIGTEVIDRFLNLGHQVICVDFIRDRIRSYESTQLPILQKIYRNLSRCQDVLEPEQVTCSDFGRIDACVHLGACVDTREWGEVLFQRNIDFTRNLVMVLPYKTRVVFASSAAVYGVNGHPCNPYGMTKSLGERILEDNASKEVKEVCSLRFFNVFGATEHHKGAMASVPFKIDRAYETEGRFDLFCPDAARDFVSVRQVVDCVVGHTLDVSHDLKSGVFDVGRGEAVTFRDLDHMLRIINGRLESCCDEVPIPKEYEGRYQFFTRAGTGAPLSPFIKPTDLRGLLEEEFNFVED